MLAHLAVQNLRRSPNSSCRFRRAKRSGNVAALSIPSLVGSLTIVLNGGASKAPAERLMQFERPAHGNGAAPDCTRRAADTGQISFACQRVVTTTLSAWLPCK